MKNNMFHIVYLTWNMVNAKGRNLSIIQSVYSFIPAKNALNVRFTDRIISNDFRFNSWVILMPSLLSRRFFASSCEAIWGFLPFELFTPGIVNGMFAIARFKAFKVQVGVDLSTSDHWSGQKCTDNISWKVMKSMIAK